MIGTFFFLSGLFAPGNISRHGPGEFLRQRLLRLGLPWLLFRLLIWPVLMWFAYRSAGHQIPIWQALQTRQPFLDSGRIVIKAVAVAVLAVVGSFTLGCLLLERSRLGHTS